MSVHIIPSLWNSILLSPLPYTHQVNSYMSFKVTLRHHIIWEAISMPGWVRCSSFLLLQNPTSLRHHPTAVNNCVTGRLSDIPQWLPPPSSHIFVNPVLLSVGWPSGLLLIDKIQQRWWDGTSVIKRHKTDCHLSKRLSLLLVLMKHAAMSETSMWQGTEGSPRPRASKEQRPSIYKTLRNWVLPTSMSVFHTLSLYLLWWSVIRDLWCYNCKKIMTHWRLSWKLAFFSNKVF